MFRGSGGCLRHSGVAVGSVEGAEGWRGPVGRRGERDDVRVRVTPKHKAAEGVAVGQDDHSLHQLGQRPALLPQQRLEAAHTEDEGPSSSGYQKKKKKNAPGTRCGRLFFYLDV